MSVTLFPEREKQDIKHTYSMGYHNTEGRHIPGVIPSELTERELPLSSLSKLMSACIPPPFFLGFQINPLKQFPFIQNVFLTRRRDGDRCPVTFAHKLCHHALVICGNVFAEVPHTCTILERSAVTMPSNLTFVYIS